MGLESDVWLLHAAVFFASLLQAAAGIGFGVIAGPIILVAMNSPAAIQVSILLSFAIAVVLAPGVVRQANRSLLQRYALGSVIGAPLGIAAFLLADITALKLMAGAAVLFMAVSAAGLLRRRGLAPRDSLRRDGGIGALSGAMSTALAMPGPAIAAEMAAQGRDKTEVRATVLTLFLISYPLAYAAQGLAAGPAMEALALSARLLPATLLGVFAGRLLVPYVSENLFRRIIVAVLLATAAGLFVSLFSMPWSRLDIEGHWARCLNVERRLPHETSLRHCTYLIEHPDLSPSERAHAYFRRASRHEFQGEVHRALGDYSSAIDLNPNIAVYHSGRGLLRIRSGVEHMLARTDFDRAKALSGKRLWRRGPMSEGVVSAAWSSLMMRRLYWFDEIDPDRWFLNMLEKSEVSDSPAAVENFNAGTRVARIDGDLKKASNHLDNAIKTDRAFASAHHNLANTKLALGHIELSAVHYIAAAIRTPALSLPSRRAIAWSVAATAEISAELRDVQRIARELVAQGDTALDWEILAMALARTGDRIAAFDAYLTAVERDPAYARDYRWDLARRGYNPGAPEGAFGDRAKTALRACLEAGCLLLVEETTEPEPGTKKPS